MSLNVVFVVALIISVLTFLRLKQSIIVTVGGGLILALVVGLIFGKPERISQDIDPAVIGNSLASSNDYEIYKEIFAVTALKLIREGKCKVSDFREIGGWLKSANHV